MTLTTILNFSKNNYFASPDSCFEPYFISLWVWFWNFIEKLKFFKVLEFQALKSNFWWQPRLWISKWNSISSLPLESRIWSWSIVVFFSEITSLSPWGGDKVCIYSILHRPYLWIVTRYVIFCLSIAICKFKLYLIKIWYLSRFGCSKWILNDFFGFRGWFRYFQFIIQKFWGCFTYFEP